MTHYDFKYEMTEAPEVRNDGSGLVSHQIRVVAKADDAEPADPFVYRAGLPSKTIIIPADDLLTVMSMPDGSGAQKTAKNTAYKNLLRDNVGTTAEPVTGWTSEVLQTILDANDLSSDAAGQATDYIVNTLNQTFPVQFNF